MSLVAEREPGAYEYTHTIQGALDILRVEPDRHLYKAATPGYLSNFSRDSLLFGMLAGDKNALSAQIEYSAEQQGLAYDPFTGEEPGKIHHEFPSVSYSERSTKYNACDTTALFLLAIAKLHESGETEVMSKYAENIDRAVGYIKSHIVDGLFQESPLHCGATGFALKVTYWKDSVLNGPKEEPTYPIVYSLVHFQNAAALKAIGRARQDTALTEVADNMVERGLEQLWSGDHFIVARDGDGEVIDPPSSDSLHSLLYIDPATIPADYSQSIEQYMNILETTVGYRTGLPVGISEDDYHTRWVWTHEQGLLYEAAKKHALEQARTIASRILPQVQARGYHELFDATDGNPGGNATQLWSVGLHQYFLNPDSSYL